MNETGMNAVRLSLEIAQRSIEFHKLERQRISAKSRLSEAYQEFAEDNSLDRIERESPEWNRMIFATKIDYDLSEVAKRNARNAKRRLDTSIRRFLKASV